MQSISARDNEIIFFIIALHKSKIKRCAQPKLRTPKNANSDCCYTKLNKHGDNSRPYIKLDFAFLPNSLLTYKHRDKTLYKNREFSRIGLLIKFCVAIVLYHNFIHFSMYFLYSSKSFSFVPSISSILFRMMKYARSIIFFAYSSKSSFGGSLRKLFRVQTRAYFTR